MKNLIVVKLLFVKKKREFFCECFSELFQKKQKKRDRKIIIRFCVTLKTIIYRDDDDEDHLDEDDEEDYYS